MRLAMISRIFIFRSSFFFYFGKISIIIHVCVVENRRQMISKNLRKVEKEREKTGENVHTEKKRRFYSFGFSQYEIRKLLPMELAENMLLNTYLVCSKSVERKTNNNNKKNTI